MLAGCDHNRRWERPNVEPSEKRAITVRLVAKFDLDIPNQRSPKNIQINDHPHPDYAKPVGMPVEKPVPPSIDNFGKFSFNAVVTARPDGELIAIFVGISRATNAGRNPHVPRPHPP